MNNAIKPFLALSMVAAISAGLFLWLSEVQKQRVAASATRTEMAPGRVNIEVRVKDGDVRVQPSPLIPIHQDQSHSDAGQNNGRRNADQDSNDALTIQVSANSSVTYAISPGPGQVVVQSPPLNSDGRVLIRIMGSDTTLEVTTAWAEAYHHLKPSVEIDVRGGGTGIGISALQNGSIQICAASREMKPEEKARLKQLTGEDAVEFTFAYDALAIYTNPKNSIKEISIEELRDIWAEGGTATTWDRVNSAMKGKIVLFGRQNSSGTHEYFREQICGKTPEMKQRNFRNGISEMNGSSEVVENIARTPQAMGYSGMGFNTDRVNWLKVSMHKGEPAVEPSTESARSGQYPLSRKLRLYTAGEPAGAVKEFIEWTLSPAGQKIVEASGFVPLT